MAWYEVKGKECDTVFSSRVRFARNLKGFCFEEGLKDGEAEEIIDRVGKALGKEFTRTDLTGIGGLNAATLVEKHLISPEFAAKKTPHALFTDDNRSLSLMACEEDHIRLQCVLPGLSLRDAYDFAASVDDRLQENLDIAFDEKLGYLTHCPTNLGTGMRASVMLFLPALTSGGFIPSLSRQLTNLGLTMRGLYGEGSKSSGCLYQISNRITLGVSEEEILRKLEETVGTVIEKERELRASVKGEAAELEADRIHRAEGILRYATRISSEEFFSLFSDLKLGIAKGIVTSITDEQLQALLISVLPATLTLCAGDPPKNGSERDTLRAKVIKEKIGAK